MQWPCPASSESMAAGTASCGAWSFRRLLRAWSISWFRVSVPSRKSFCSLRRRVRASTCIQDFAYPLPIRIIAELLGIPLQDQATFRRWSETLVAGPRTDARRGRSFAEERTRTLVELNDYLAGQLEARRRTPGGDLISRLLAAEVDGERLTETELLEFCRLLLIAGYETTACQIGIGALALAEMPDVAAELRADPALVPSAVEELVRCFPSGRRHGEGGARRRRVGRSEDRQWAVSDRVGGLRKLRRRGLRRAGALRYPKVAQSTPWLRTWTPLLPGGAPCPPGGAPRARGLARTPGTNRTS